MKIALVGTRGIPALYGGFETAVQEIGRRLVERGHEVVVYCRGAKASDDAEPRYLGMRQVHLPKLRLRAAETLSHTLASLLHQVVRPADVILVFNPANGPLCLLPWALRRPFAINVDGLEWRRAKWGRLGRSYLRFAAWLSTRIAPAIIADSRGIESYYRQRFGSESCFVPYGAYPEHSTDPALLEEFSLAAGEYFLVVARLEPENNTDLVIEAFERVRTDMKLAIVGGVSYESAYSKRLRATTDPRVRFLGGIYDQTKLTEVMCDCFAYVHGHEVGGTNPILLKALGCGTRLLYLDNDFNREVAGELGQGSTKSVAALAELMQRAVDDPASAPATGDAGRARIREIYNWERVTDGYEALCRELAGEVPEASDLPPGSGRQGARSGADQPPE